MPYGRWPERVKAFRKWSNERVDKAQITDSVTGSRASRGGRTHARKRRKRRRKKEED